MKKLVAIAILFGALTMNAQDKKEVSKEAPKEGWKKGGQISLLFNQSAFSNWLAGGTDNVAGNLGLNYDFNYLKGDWTWDNKLIVSYGLTKITGKPTQKTDDRLELNSLLGKKASEYWYYSAFFNFKTQMSATYEKGKLISHFFSPAYFQFGPGMLWKKHDNLKINFAPATSRLIVLSKALAPAFGVKAGKSTRYELGASVNAYYKLNILPNVSMENILNLYSNYLDKPGNIDVDYTINFVMKINKFMSANLSLQAIYDDNAIQRLQTREVFGLGFNYGF